MPDLVTHFRFAQTVLDAASPSVRSCIRPELYSHASAGPDVWFSVGFYGGAGKEKADRGNVMHEQRTGDFLMALAREARCSPARDAVFSYLAGFLCHYALDSVAHPYIVAKTGDYRGTPETAAFRGGHMRLEHAIDCYTIRSAYHTVPWRFPFLRLVLTLPGLPGELRLPLDRAYASVYGWTDAWRDLNRAVRDQRRLYAVVRDPCGVVNAVAGALDDGRSAYDYRQVSYFRKDLDSERIDYLNLRHTPWRHPWDDNIMSTDSFLDLFEKARLRAIQYGESAWRYVYLSEEGRLGPLLGSVSYTTGLDCSDARNARPPLAEPLFVSE